LRSLEVACVICSVITVERDQSVSVIEELGFIGEVQDRLSCPGHWRLFNGGRPALETSKDLPPSRPPSAPTHLDRELATARDGFARALLGVLRMD